MGNRCVITNKDKSKSIYLHWNGGRDTIEPMLRVAKRHGGTFEILSAIAHKVFDGEITPYEMADTDNGDNGVYIVDDNLNIIGREFFGWKEQQSHNPYLMEIVIEAQYLLGETLANPIIVNAEHIIKNTEIAIKKASNGNKDIV